LRGKSLLAVVTDIWSVVIALLEKLRSEIMQDDKEAMGEMTL